VNDIQLETDYPPKSKGGRPKKLKTTLKEFVSNPPATLPKTDHQRMRELKDLMIRSGGKDVAQKLIDIALNDNHPAQITAIKMCIDRTLPISMFEKDKTQRGAVTINITGIGATTIQANTEEEENIEDIEPKYG
jgi:hypothetical protein